MIEANWNSFLLQLSSPHILQTKEWAQIKSNLGWTPIYFAYPTSIETPTAAALLLKRQLYFGGFSPAWRILYTPKGPIVDWSSPGLPNQVLAQLENIARRENVIFLKIDPDIILGEGLPGKETATTNPVGSHMVTELQQRGWIRSSEQIQFRNTFIIDLNVDEETLLARMKQKTRYNIRLASRKGIEVRLGSCDDLELLFRMYAETSIRDKFIIREREYYLRTWKTFVSSEMADVLLADYQGETIAGLILFRFGGKAWYMYGMSRDIHRERMPSYLLQWEAIRHAKLMGCTIYDFWGAPDQFNERDPMWGVFRFKEGFGGTIIRTIGAWDYPVRPMLYRFYSYLLPKILGIMRRRGLSQTRSMLNM